MRQSPPERCGLFNLLGTTQLQVVVVPLDVLQKFELVGNLRMKLALHAIDVAFVAALNSIAIATGEQGGRLFAPLDGKRRKAESRPNAPPPR